MLRLVLCLVVSWVAQERPQALEPTGKLDIRLIPEASGIVKSRRHPGVFWVHNDSGNPPSIFAIRSDGRIIREFRLEIPNIDWEDIAIDDQGHLYVGDIGNNLGALPTRAIYRIDEPDPSQPPAGPLKSTAVVRYASPRENRFDAESLEYDQGNAIVIAKYRDGREAEIFSVAFDTAKPPLKPVEPRSLGRLAGFIEPATGSDLSTDRKLLAVCSSAVTRIYRREDGGKLGWKLVSEVRYPRAQIEGICWDGSDLILVAEGGAIFRTTEKTWRAAPANPKAARRGDRETSPDSQGTGPYQEMVKA